MTAGSERDVRRIVENWFYAVRRRDIDGVVAHHSDDVVFYDVPEPTEVRGIDAYRRSWQDFLGWVAGFDTNDLEVYAGEDVAFCHALIRCSGETEPVPFLVRLTIGCRRIDGRWVITHEHHSVPAAS